MTDHQDLVARLRSLSRFEHDDASVGDEAADAIEALEKDAERLRKAVNYELDDLDRALLVKVRRAIAYDDEGDPVKDVIDYDEMVDAMRLLVDILDAESK